ncbi:MAG: hypothetical protein ACREOW_14880 [Thermodesulfobacteriota bacterium]
MFSKIGLFHFGNNHTEPIGSLTTAIKNKSNEIANSLIVLPEAINITENYRYLHGMYDYNSASAIKNSLSLISGKYKISFVAGLVAPTQDSPSIQYSSAYFINGKEITVMCHKKSDDGTGNYTPYQNWNDIKNPLHIDDAIIACLICMDLGQPCSNQIIKRVDDESGDNKIICIPAHMSEAYLNGGKQGSILENRWKNKIIILSNSYANGCNSFICNRNGEIKWTISGKENDIILIDPKDAA